MRRGPRNKSHREREMGTTFFPLFSNHRESCPMKLINSDIIENANYSHFFFFHGLDLFLLDNLKQFSFFNWNFFFKDSTEEKVFRLSYESCPYCLPSFRRLGGFQLCAYFSPLCERSFLREFFCFVFSFLSVPKVIKTRRWGVVFLGKLVI